MLKLKPFPEFITERNKLLRRGDKVLYVGSPGYFNKIYKKRFPATPEFGFYTLDIVFNLSHHAVFGFKYMPTDKAFSRYEQYHKRRQKITWCLEDSITTGIIPCEHITRAELVAYMNDDSQNEYIDKIRPMLQLLLNDI